MRDAWLTAALGRADKMPALDDLIGSPESQLTPEDRAAEMRAEMAAARLTMEKRSWKEWQAV